MGFLSAVSDKADSILAHKSSASLTPFHCHIFPSTDRAKDAWFGGWMAEKLLTWRELLQE